MIVPEWHRSPSPTQAEVSGKRNDLSLRWLQEASAHSGGGQGMGKRRAAGETVRANAVMPWERMSANGVRGGGQFKLCRESRMRGEETWVWLTGGGCRGTDRISDSASDAGPQRRCGAEVGRGLAVQQPVTTWSSVTGSFGLNGRGNPAPVREESGREQVPRACQQGRGQRTWWWEPFGVCRMQSASFCVAAVCGR
jgi:hypothetical protein